MSFISPGKGLLFLALFSPLCNSWGGPLAAQERAGDRFAALAARSIGPAGMSGRITAIDAVTSDPDRLIVGAATGGVWKSENGGQTWTPLFDDEPLQGIGAVAIFQPNPDIIWVGTGEGNPRNSAGVGEGIFRSTDGGKTWEFLGLERSERIHRILLHPTNPEVAYVGVMGPAWSDGKERGVYKTVDGGKSWERILFVNEKTGVGDLAMDPGNPDNLLVGMWEFRRQPWFFESGGPGSGLFLTTDGGGNWTRLTEADGLPPGELGRIGLAFSQSDAGTVYALVEAETSALLRSHDGGRNWETVNSEEGVARRPFYYADIVVDPQDGLRIYNLQSSLLRSEDGGATFSEIAPEVHSDFHALWISPQDPGLMYAGTDGGVYITRDGGENWGMVRSLPVGQFYHVAVDMEIPFNVYGGMQDNGSWRGPSDRWAVGGIQNHHWTEVAFGDGFGTVPDPTDPNLGFAMSQGGGLIRFNVQTGERKDVRPWAPEGVDLRFNWNAAMALDPLQPGTLYYGSQFVHKTSNGGDTWEIISPDLTTDDPAKQRQDQSGGITRDVTGAENFTTLLAIAPSPVQEELIWVGSDDGQVHLTQSGGGYWEDVGRKIRGVPKGTWIPHIEASKHQAGTAYVIFDDHRRGNWKPYILRTEDFGDHWDNLADQDQIKGFVHTLEEDPVTPNLLFAGTEFGLYVSLNRGKDWLLWTHGIPRVPVRSLVIHPRDHDLVVGTHGRGIFILDDIRPLRAMADNPHLSDAPVYLFSPPPAYLRTTAAADGSHFPGDAMFRGETRPQGALLTYSVGPRVEEGQELEEVALQILDDQGRAVRNLSGPADPGLHRLGWDLREDGPVTDGGAGIEEGVGIPGPEVLPGSYRVEISLGNVGASQDVEVLADPRVQIPLADRIEKRNAVRRAVNLLSLAQDAQLRARQVSEVVDRVVEELGERPDSAHTSLRELLGEIRVRTAEVGERTRDANRYRRMVFSLRATRDAPTEAQRIALFKMGQEVDGAVASVNGLLTGPFDQLRTLAAEAGLTPIPELQLVFRTPDGARIP